MFPTSFSPSHTLGPSCGQWSTSVMAVSKHRGAPRNAAAKQKMQSTIANDRICKGDDVVAGKNSQKHASARGPDPRAAVKTVGMGLADWSVLPSFRAIRLRRRGEREDRRFCGVDWRGGFGWGLSIFFQDFYTCEVEGCRRVVMHKYFFRRGLKER
jgi:hypothetical protein